MTKPLTPKSGSLMARSDNHLPPALAIIHQDVIPMTLLLPSGSGSYSHCTVEIVALV